MVLKDNKKTVEMQDGYTDGEFNYYKSDNGYWYCIEPSTGLSVAYCKTRKEAQEKGQSLIEKIKKAITDDKKAYFQRCLQTA